MVLKSFDYIGNVFMTIKEPDYSVTNNAFFSVYKVVVTVTTKVKQTAEDGTETEVDQATDYTYYYDVEYDDVIVSADGVVDYNNVYYYTPYSTITLKDTDITLYGYESVDAYLAIFDAEEFAPYNVTKNVTP